MILCFLLPVTATAQKRGQTGHCQSRLPFFIMKDGKWQEIKNAAGGISFTSASAAYFAVGGSLQKPMLKIFPWVGIHFEKTSRFPANTTMKTDGQKHFVMQDRSRGILVECQIRDL